MGNIDSEKKARNFHQLASASAHYFPLKKDKDKVKSETKGLADSIELRGSMETSEASAQELQIVNFFRQILIDQFGEKTGEDAFESITAELKRNKDKVTLNFDFIKRAVMGAAARNGDNMTEVQNKLSELEKGDPEGTLKGLDTLKSMNAAVNRHLSDHYDPSRLNAFIEQSRRLTLRFLNNLQDAKFQQEIKELMLKREELKAADEEQSV